MITFCSTGGGELGGVSDGGDEGDGGGEPGTGDDDELEPFSPPEHATTARPNANAIMCRRIFTVLGRCYGGVIFALCDAERQL
jgi:hypothetical protein